MNHDAHRIIIDVETKNLFEDVGGREHLEKLEPSLVGTYDYTTDRYRAYRDTELDALAATLRDATRIIGFNLHGFDLPVLAAHLGRWLLDKPTLDLLDEARRGGGRTRINLAALAQGTLGATKSGDGVNAVRLYREGRWDELERYCLDDVRITRELYEYGLEHGYLYVNKAASRPRWWRGQTHDDGSTTIVGVAYGRNPHRDTLERAAAARADVIITYRGAARTVRADSFDGAFLRGHDSLSGEERSFRLDRIETARLLDTPAPESPA